VCNAVAKYQYSIVYHARIQLGTPAAASHSESIRPYVQDTKELLCTRAGVDRVGDSLEANKYRLRQSFRSCHANETSCKSANSI